jgi:hypothetical protein
MAIEYSAVTELSKNMQRAADNAPKIVNTWLHQMVGPDLVREMSQRAPYKTGNLRDHIRQINLPGQVTVGPYGVGYNEYVVQGTKPHDIKPKKGKYLVFQINGRKVFAKKVHHPGTKPNPYMTDSANVVMRRMVPKLSGLTVQVLRTGDV